MPTKLPVDQKRTIFPAIKSIANGVWPFLVEYRYLNSKKEAIAALILNAVMGVFPIIISIVALYMSGRLNDDIFSNALKGGDILMASTGIHAASFAVYLRTNNSGKLKNFFIGFLMFLLAVTTSVLYTTFVLNSNGVFNSLSGVSCFKLSYAIWASIAIYVISLYFNWNTILLDFEKKNNEQELDQIPEKKKQAFDELEASFEAATQGK